MQHGLMYNMEMNMGGNLNLQNGGMDMKDDKICTTDIYGYKNCVDMSGNGIKVTDSQSQGSDAQKRAIANYLKKVMLI